MFEKLVVIEKYLVVRVDRNRHHHRWLDRLKALPRKPFDFREAVEREREEHEVARNQVIRGERHQIGRVPPVGLEILRAEWSKKRIERNAVQAEERARRIDPRLERLDE